MSIIIHDNLNLKVDEMGRRHDADQHLLNVVTLLQDKWKSEGKDIAIWYTLPILPTGLTPGMNVPSDAKAKGVDWRVERLTMDSNAICQFTEGQNNWGNICDCQPAFTIERLHPNKSDEIDAMNTDGWRERRSGRGVL